MEYRDLSEETVDAYLAYLEKAVAEDPEMMFVQTVDPDGIRARVADPFYRQSTSILAVEDGLVLGRLEYHFYGCLQDGFRMAYVDWVYVRKAFRHNGIAQGLFRELEKRCWDNHIDEYFLIPAQKPNADRFYGAFSDVNQELTPILRKSFTAT